MPDSSDAELLTLWREQESEAAFRTLAERYAGLVFSSARRSCGDDTLAAEASQMTFITLARKAGSLATRDCLAGWLHVTAIMHARNLSQLRAREQRKREKLGHHLETMTDPAHPALWDQLAPVLDESLAALPKSDRDTILLRHYRALSVREIAAHLAISAEAAQKRLDRAMERLRCQLAARGCAAGAGLGGTLLAGLSREAKAGLPLAGCFVSAALRHAPSAAPSLLAFLMTKKIALPAALLLVLAGGGAWLASEKSTDLATAASSDAPPPRSSPAAPANKGLLPIDTGRSATAAKEARDRLIERYGEEAVRKSQTGAEAAVAFSKSILAQTEWFAGMVSPPWQSFLPHLQTKLHLTPAQGEEADKLLGEFLKRQFAERKASLERLARDPAPLMEVILSSDACARGSISRKDYDSLLERLGPGVRAVEDPIDSNMQGISFRGDYPLLDGDFADRFRKLLEGPQREIVDAEIAKANDPREGYQSESNFAALPPTELDILMEKIEATRKIVTGSLVGMEEEREELEKSIRAQEEAR